MIQIYDNFLSQAQNQCVIQYALSAPYYYGETDTPGGPVTGLVNVIDKKHDIYRLFHYKTRDLVPEDMDLYRVYINCFSPSERPYFHRDGDTGVTFLYYVNGTDELDDGGETQIVDEGVIKGILPLHNRMLQFDANMLHRATTYRNNHRFTLAVKYGRLSATTI